MQHLIAMANPSVPVDSPLSTVLHRLASYEPRDGDVISLYVNLGPDQNGRSAHDVFLRRTFADQLKAAAARPDTADGLTRAVARIEAFLTDDVDRTAKAAAIFASADGDEFFEAVPLDAPIDAHQLFLGPVPHLFPLVRLINQYPRYAALLLDTNRARIIVFELGAVETRAEVSGEKTRRHSMGGWSQARYQRRTENLHLQHLKEVVETLERVVRDEAIDHVIVAGDATVVARLQEQLPDPLASKVVDAVRLDRHAAEHEIVDEAMAALRRNDAQDDRERVAEVIGAWRASGLGVAGPEATLRALQIGQVDELLIAATPAILKAVQALPDDAAAAPSTAARSAPDGAEIAQLHLADELVTRATQSGAAVRIIEDAALLEDHGGVAAALRFRL